MVFGNIHNFRIWIKTIDRTKTIQLDNTKECCKTTTTFSQKTEHNQYLFHIYFLESIFDKKGLFFNLFNFWLFFFSLNDFPWNWLPVMRLCWMHQKPNARGDPPFWIFCVEKENRGGKKTGEGTFSGIWCFDYKFMFKNLINCLWLLFLWN